MIFRIKTFFVAAAIFFGLNLFINKDCRAESLVGIDFQDQLKTDRASLKLQGLGIKKLFMVKVFVAGFYLGKGVDIHDALFDFPKRIEVYYFQNIPAAKLARETRQRILVNVTKEEWGKMEQRVNVMDGYFVDVKPGDRFDLTYVPGVGTKFEYNEKLIGIIEGGDFAKALFSVWIGQHPIDQNLKAQLLNKDKKIK